MEHKLWIDGSWAESAGGRRIAIENPATGEPIAEVVDASRADVDRAVQAAHVAFADGRERVQGFVARARANGAKILTGGGVPADWQQGYYFEPTVVADADQRSEIIQNEVFGPVITISAFDDQADALRLGNDVLYGLAASVRCHPRCNVRIERVRVHRSRNRTRTKRPNADT